MKIRLIICFAFVALSLGAFGQPPPPDGERGTDSDKPASIGGGLLILLGLGAAYGAKKVYNARRRLLE